MLRQPNKLALDDEYAGVIDYAAAPTGPAGRSLEPLYIALAVPAMVAVFAPLVLGTSPAHEMALRWNRLIDPNNLARFDDIWVFFLAVGFLLAFPIFVWQLRLILGIPGPAEARAVSVVGKILAIPVLCVPIGTSFVMFRDRSDQVREDEVLGVIAILLTLGTLIVGWWLEKRVARSAPSGHAVTVQLMSAYVANAWLPIIAVTQLGLEGKFGITLFASGYLLTLASVAIFICQLALMMTRPWPPRGFKSKVARPAST